MCGLGQHGVHRLQDTDELVHGGTRMKTTGDGFEGEKEAGGAAHLGEHDGELERTGGGGERRGRRRRKKMLAAGLLTDERS